MPSARACTNARRSLLHQLLRIVSFSIMMVIGSAVLPNANRRYDLLPSVASLSKWVFARCYSLLTSLSRINAHSIRCKALLQELTNLEIKLTENIRPNTHNACTTTIRTIASLRTLHWKGIKFISWSICIKIHIFQTRSDPTVDKRGKPAVDDTFVSKVPFFMQYIS